MENTQTYLELKKGTLEFYYNNELIHSTQSIAPKAILEHVEEKTSGKIYKKKSKKKYYRIEDNLLRSALIEKIFKINKNYVVDPINTGITLKKPSKKNSNSMSRSDPYTVVFASSGLLNAKTIELLKDNEEECEDDNCADANSVEAPPAISSPVPAPRPAAPRRAPLPPNLRENLKDDQQSSASSSSSSASHSPEVPITKSTVQNPVLPIAPQTGDTSKKQDLIKSEILKRRKGIENDSESEIEDSSSEN